MNSSSFTTLRLATDPLPHRDRAEVVREVFGRTIFNLELEPDPDQPLRTDFQLQAMSGLKIVTGSASGVVSRRTKAQLADSNDDLFLSLNETEMFSITHRGHTTQMGPGDAVLATCAEPISFRRRSGRAIGLRVPRAALAHLAPTVEDLTGRPILRSNEALRLLRGYIGSLKDEVLSAPMLQHLFVTHVHDLLTLALDSTGDTRARAAGRGLKAAQLREIKSYISNGLVGGDLSVATVAAAHKLEPRYVQRLFEAEGTTFSTFVIGQRLARAHRMLCDPRNISEPVGLIAFNCGFGNASHFTRMFRRVYGAAPSDIRATQLEPSVESMS